MLALFGTWKEDLEDWKEAVSDVCADDADPGRRYFNLVLHVITTQPNMAINSYSSKNYLSSTPSTSMPGTFFHLAAEC